MTRTDDVQRLVDVLKRHEYDCWPIPVDMRQMIVSALEGLLKERDAAVEDLRMLGQHGENTCCVCLYRNQGDGGEKCIGCLIEDKWEWRGVQEV